MEDTGNRHPDCPTYTCQIHRGQDVGDHVEYRLLVQHRSGLSWQVLRRFSDFVNFHEEVTNDQPPDVVARLPVPPRKSWLPAFTQSGEFLEQRRYDLQVYLNAVLGRPDLNLAGHRAIPVLLGVQMPDQPAGVRIVPRGEEHELEVRPLCDAAEAAPIDEYYIEIVHLDTGAVHSFTRKVGSTGCQPQRARIGRLLPGKHQFTVAASNVAGSSAPISVVVDTAHLLPVDCRTPAPVAEPLGKRRSPTSGNDARASPSAGVAATDSSPPSEHGALASSAVSRQCQLPPPPQPHLHVQQQPQQQVQPHHLPHHQQNTAHLHSPSQWPSTVCGFTQQQPPLQPQQPLPPQPPQPQQERGLCAQRRGHKEPEYPQRGLEQARLSSATYTGAAIGATSSSSGYVASQGNSSSSTTRVPSSAGQRGPTDFRHFSTLGAPSQQPPFVDRQASLDAGVTLRRHLDASLGLEPVPSTSHDSISARRMSAASQLHSAVGRPSDASSMRRQDSSVARLPAQQQRMASPGLPAEQRAAGRTCPPVPLGFAVAVNTSGKSTVPPPASAASTTCNESGDDNDDENCCVVCMTSERSHAFVPCGHRCVCAACSAEILRVGKAVAECPVCRTPATGALQIFT